MRFVSLSSLSVRWYSIRSLSHSRLFISAPVTDVCSSRKQHFLHNAQSCLLTNHRFVRSGRPPVGENSSESSNSSRDAEENDGSKKASDSGDQDGSNQQEKRKIDPATLKKLRLYVLAVASLSFVTSFFILTQFATGGREMHGLNAEDLKGPGIDMQQFTDKYLRSGEVKKIIFVPAEAKAVAVLHEGAVVDGRKAAPVVCVDYSHSAQQFWADVRKVEADLGIPLTQGVDIQYYQGMTTLKMLEFFIGFTIIVWLGSQYGRLLMRRLAANKAKQSGGNVKND